MNGQWMGRYEGTTAGKIIVNIDARGSFYEGVAYVFEDEQGLPASAAFFKTPDKNANAAFRTDYIGVIDPTSANPTPWNDNLKKQFPRVEAFSEYADVQLAWKAEALSLRWKTDTGVECHCTLPRSKADQPSELPAPVQDSRWLERVFSVPVNQLAEVITHPTRSDSGFETSAQSSSLRRLFLARLTPPGGPGLISQVDGAPRSRS